MVYFEDNEVLIRDMIQSDAPIITNEEIAQGWHQTIEKYEMRLQHQAQGKSFALIAEYKGNVAGYINIYPNSEGGAFANQGYPEIVDFGVLVKYRRNGIGNKLMDIAEDIASRYSDTVYLGVGVHNGYGSAQRMYVKRGYIPDGTGVWYRGSVCPQYTDCCNDDDLEELEQCEMCEEWYSPDDLHDTTEMINGGCGYCCEQCIEDADMVEM